MDWHKPDELPKRDKTLYLVEIMTNDYFFDFETQYEVMWYQSSAQSFSKQDDRKGIMVINRKNIIRWTEIC
jgi:hypothetical protein